MHWFNIAWWKYLLDKPFSLRAFFCRAKGHEGVYWYSGDLELDMHCRNCGDDLG